MNTIKRLYGHKTISLFILISLAIMSSCFHQTKPDSNDVNFTTIDFSPSSGGWNINKQSGNLTFSDVKRYRLNIRLDRPAPSTFSWAFGVYEDRFFWSDPHLGTFLVTFNAGSSTASNILYRANAGANRTPTGAVDLNGNEMWLGCTGKKGKVRGNSGKGDNGHADVYLERNTLLMPAGTTVTAGGTVESPRRSIRCI